MGVIQRKNLDQPDELRRTVGWTGSLTTVGSHTIGRGVLEPGWRWSTHMAPVMDLPSCPIHHVQVLLSGRFAVRMDDGEEAEFGPNDIFDIPPGHDAWVVGDEPVVLLDVAGNIGAIGVPREHERFVATLLMTDIVDSTRIAARMGDAAWRQVLNQHNHVVRIQLDRFQGVEVDTTGDGFLARFSSAAGALRCADAIRRAVPGVGVEVRIGVHTGEIELREAGIGGLAVHAVARIMALGGPADVLVSGVTQSLVEGSGLTLREHGRHQLKGLERPIDVYRLMA